MSEPLPGRRFLPNPNDLLTDVFGERREISFLVRVDPIGSLGDLLPGTEVYIGGDNGHCGKHARHLQWPSVPFPAFHYLSRLFTTVSNEANSIGKPLVRPVRLEEV